MPSPQPGRYKPTPSALRRNQCQSSSHAARYVASHPVATCPPISSHHARRKVLFIQTAFIGDVIGFRVVGSVACCASRRCHPSATAKEMRRCSTGIRSWLACTSGIRRRAAAALPVVECTGESVASRFDLCLPRIGTLLRLAWRSGAPIRVGFDVHPLRRISPIRLWV